MGAPPPTPTTPPPTQPRRLNILSGFRTQDVIFQGACKLDPSGSQISVSTKLLPIRSDGRYSSCLHSSQCTFCTFCRGKALLWILSAEQDSLSDRISEQTWRSDSFAYSCWHGHSVINIETEGITCIFYSSLRAVSLFTQGLMAIGPEDHASERESRVFSRGEANLERAREFHPLH